MFFVNLYCLNFLKLWEKSFHSVELLKKEWLNDLRGSWKVLRASEMKFTKLSVQDLKNKVVFV